MQSGEPDDDLLPLLLEMCEDYFASTNPAGRRELDVFQRARDIAGGPGWLIDIVLRQRSWSERERLSWVDQIQ